MAERVKESLLPVQNRAAILKYLAGGAPGTIRGDLVEVVRDHREPVIGGWIGSDRYGLMVQTGRAGIESVPLDQVVTVERWQEANNSWPGCCQITPCTLTQSRGMQA